MKITTRPFSIASQFLWFTLGSWAVCALCIGTSGRHSFFDIVIWPTLIAAVLGSLFTAWLALTAWLTARPRVQSSVASLLGGVICYLVPYMATKFLPSYVSRTTFEAMLLGMLLGLPLIMAELSLQIYRRLRAPEALKAATAREVQQSDISRPSIKTVAPSPLIKRVLRVICIAFLGIAAVGVVFYSFLSDGRSYQSPAIAFQGNSKDLRQSVVVPTLDTPIPKSTNVVWCGAIQLGWNRLGKDVLHSPPNVQGAEAVVSRLNQMHLTEDDISPESYFATAGFVRDGVVDDVKAKMKRRFQDEVTFDSMSPNSVLVYAYLQANVPFTIPFFDNRKALRFQDSCGKETEVSSFGIEEKHEYAYHTLRKQIDVLYLLRKPTKQDALEEFAIDLCCNSSPNQLVLACVPQKATLLETFNDVQKKTQKYARQPESEYHTKFGVRDVLLVPNLNWEVRHHFSELEGNNRRFLNSGFADFYIEKAAQVIRFKLDRSGAELASEFQQICKPMATRFVCDRPFLIYIKKRDSEHPFFMMWVDNAELLSKPLAP